MCVDTIDDFRKMQRLTWCKPNGEWGIGDVDLDYLPPRVYAALVKLKALEDALEEAQGGD